MTRAGLRFLPGARASADIPCPAPSLWGPCEEQITYEKPLEQSWAQSSPLILETMALWFASMETTVFSHVFCFSWSCSLPFFFSFSPKNTMYLPCVLTFIHLLIILSCPWDSLSSWSPALCSSAPFSPLSPPLPHPHLCLPLALRRLFIVHSLPCLLSFFSFLLESEGN